MRTASITFPVFCGDGESKMISQSYVILDHEPQTSYRLIKEVWSLLRHQLTISLKEPVTAQHIDLDAATGSVFTIFKAKVNGRAGDPVLDAVAVCRLKWDGK
jgi:hypothetical protein